MNNIKEIGDALIQTVKEYVGKQFQTVSDRLEKMQARVDSLKDGKDGAKGDDGKSVSIADVEPILEGAFAKWALEFERRASDSLQKAIDRMPTPKDGANGADGKDGLGFDDLSFEYDGERGITLKFQRGEVVKEHVLRIPVVLDRGVFKSDATYEAGDCVTWAGSYWVAKSQTNLKPDAADSGWRLAVKRGRDGKDGTNGKDLVSPVKVQA